MAFLSLDDLVTPAVGSRQSIGGDGRSKLFRKLIYKQTKNELTSISTCGEKRLLLVLKDERTKAEQMNMEELNY